MFRIMDDLTPELQEILDRVIFDLRVGATSKRRIRNLVATHSEDQRFRTLAAAVQYLQAHNLPSTDPLSHEVVEALVKGAIGTQRQSREGIATRASGAGREQKGRDLARLPQGMRVEYDGMGAEVRSGHLYLDDGHRFDSPSPAACYVTGQKAVNGWFAWRVVGDGRYIGDYYDQSL